MIKKILIVIFLILQINIPANAIQLPNNFCEKIEYSIEIESENLLTDHLLRDITMKKMMEKEDSLSLKSYTLARDFVIQSSNLLASYSTIYKNLCE